MIKTTISAVLILLSGISLSAQSYTIDDFLQDVKANNKDILLAAKDLEIAEAQRKEASSSAYPHLSAEADYNRNLKEGYMYADLGVLSGNPDAGSTKLKITYDNEFIMQTVLSQQIFNYSVFNAIKASKQYEKLTGYAYDATMQGCNSRK